MWHRVQDAPFCEFCGRTMHIAAASETTNIPSRVRTLDLKKKPEATLNKDHLKQVTLDPNPCAQCHLKLSLTFEKFVEVGRRWFC